MKTNDVLDVHERQEKIIKIFSIISAIGIAISIIFMILNIVLEIPIFGTIAVYGFITFIFPFVLLQFFMSAGIYPQGLGRVYILFYMGFILCDMLFFSGINALFHFVPTYYYSHNIGTEITLFEIEEYRRQAWLMIAMIYILFNGAGLLYRIGKDIFKKRQILLLSL